MDHFAQISQWLSIVGTPSIFVMTTVCIKFCLGYTKKLSILMKAQQAQMRAQLLRDYNEYIDKGYVLQIELDEWMNQYESYHQLGANGVLDQRKDQLLQLPNRP